MLAVIEEQTKQICQIRVQVWGGEDKEHQHKALTMMATLAKQYSAGSLKKDKIYQARDAMLKSQGLSVRVVIKKPASAEPQSAPAMKRPAAAEALKVEKTEREKDVQCHVKPGDIVRLGGHTRPERQLTNGRKATVLAIREGGNR